jgi:hypothetical protein
MANQTPVMITTRYGWTAWISRYPQMARTTHGTAKITIQAWIGSPGITPCRDWAPTTTPPPMYPTSSKIPIRKRTTPK